MNFAFDGAGKLILGHFQIVCELKIQPETWARIEVSGQPQGRVWSNATALVDDLGNSRHWDTEIEREPVHAEAGGSP